MSLELHACLALHTLRGECGPEQKAREETNDDESDQCTTFHGGFVRHGLGSTLRRNRFPVAGLSARNAQRLPLGRPEVLRQHDNLTYVLRDVREGYVSIERARDDYGVALDVDGSAVDVDATTELRRQLRDRRAQGAS